MQSGHEFAFTAVWEDDEMLEMLLLLGFYLKLFIGLWIALSFGWACVVGGALGFFLLVWVMAKHDPNIP